MDAKDRHQTSIVIALCCGISLAVIFIYAPVANYGFLNYDDTEYVTGNRHVRSGLSWEGIRWAFTEFHFGHWHPLTWLSLMLDCHLFGAGVDDGGGHHLVNVALHIVNSILLLLVLRRMTRQLWPSALVAALFAVHPLRVESVAWITERKDVLSGLFFMLTLWAYVWYAERGGVMRYLLVMAAFSLGLLAKPILVTLPFVLLLLDFWPLRRIQIGARAEIVIGDQSSVIGKEDKYAGILKPTGDPEATAAPTNPKSEIGVPATAGHPQFIRLLLEKVPLLYLSAVSCLVSVLAQQATGAVSNLQTISLPWRLVNAAVSYVMYLVKSVRPTNLAVLYPHPATAADQQFNSWLMMGIAAGLLLGVVTVAALSTARRCPFFVAGWLWYLGMLVPVIGLFQVGMQAWADRFGYLPLIGVYIISAWCLQTVTSRFPNTRVGLTGIVCCALIALAISARGQVGVWKDSRTLFEHALAVTKNNSVAHNNLGNALRDLGYGEEALVNYQAAERLQLNNAETHYNWGLTLQGLGRIAEAMARYEEAVHINPDHAAAHNNWGNCLAVEGRFVEAVAHYEKAVRLDPDDARAHNNWGICLAKLGRFVEAAQHFQEALRLDPDCTSVRDNLRRAKAQVQQNSGP